MTRTPSYRFTVQRLDDPRIANLRENAKALTKNDRINGVLGENQRYQVSVKARLGKDSPYRDLYRTRSGRIDTQYVRVEHGAYWDVYVHTKTDWPRSKPTYVHAVPAPPIVGAWDDLKDKHRDKFDYRLAAFLKAELDVMTLFPDFLPDHIARELIAERLTAMKDRVILYRI